MSYHAILMPVILYRDTGALNTASPFLLSWSPPFRAREVRLTQDRGHTILCISSPARDDVVCSLLLGCGPCDG